eukprot:970114-Rhodomonas_salina.3
MDKIAKQFQVEDFPTLVLLRGGEEVPRGRVKGAVRGIERLLQVLTEHVTEADKSGAKSAISLRARYAMSGTEIAYGSISPFAHATRCPGLT